MGEQFCRGIVANGLVLGKAFSANAFNELYPVPQESPSIGPAQRQELRHDRQPEHGADPISGIVNTVLDLADTEAYEEQQRIERRRRKRQQRR